MPTKRPCLLIAIEFDDASVWRSALRPERPALARKPILNLVDRERGC